MTSEEERSVKEFIAFVRKNHRLFFKFVVTSYFLGILNQSIADQRDDDNVGSEVFDPVRSLKIRGIPIVTE